jgi:elongation factor Ts
VPDERVAEERAILESREEVTSKPEHIRPKIVEGMLQKSFFGASVLLDQEWIHDSSLTVGKALQQAGLEVIEFERFALSDR